YPGFLFEPLCQNRGMKKVVKPVTLRIRKPVQGTPPPNRVPLPKSAKLKLDIVDLLLEERREMITATAPSADQKSK
ncbi:MAG: hypothetical protein WA463_00755, partial [Terriglobales bacterium]